EKLGYRYALQLMFISLVILFYALFYIFNLEYLVDPTEGYVLGPFNQRPRRQVLPQATPSFHWV
ncbi:hypothetical protein MXE23_14905, partial [Legionella pneumophila]